MEIGIVLKRESKNGTNAVAQIEFEGEGLGSQRCAPAGGGVDVEKGCGQDGHHENGKGNEAGRPHPSAAIVLLDGPVHR